DQQVAAELLHHQIRNLLDGIEDARRGFAMDGEDVGDGRVFAENLLKVPQVGRGVLRRIVRDHGAAGDLCDLLGTLPICAVDQHQKLAVARHEAGDHRLDGEGARTLHWDGDMRALTAGELDDPVQNHTVYAQELRIARTPVVNHRVLDRP